MTEPGSAGRPRNAAATRSAILGAARTRFAQDGYDAARLRDIAAEVGVDPALVLRYFGSKEELFAAVLEDGASASALFEGQRAEFGMRVARMLILERVESHNLDHLLMILRSAASPKAGEIVRRNVEKNFYAPLQAYLGGGETDRIRARLVGAMIMGAAISRAIDNNGLDADADRARLCELLAEGLQRAVQ